jgi:Na+/H+ antiporter NhaD/arsenite permease-like protein
VANIIVVDAAERCGLRIDWRTHARVGVPATLTTLAIVALDVALRMYIGHVEGPRAPFVASLP